MTSFYFSWLVLSLATSPAVLQEGLAERLDAGKQTYFEGRHLEALGLLEALASELEIQASWPIATCSSA